MQNIIGLRTLWAGLLLALAVAVAAACTGGDDDDVSVEADSAAVEADGAAGEADGASDSAERLQVVASTGIIGHFAEQIAGDDADVSSLIPPGADVHSFSPSAGAIRTVAVADLVIVNGYNLEESTLDTIFEQLADDAVLVVATAGIASLEGGHHHDHGHEEDGHDDHEDDGHEDDGHEDDGHDDHEEDGHEDDGHEEDGHDDHEEDGHDDHEDDGHEDDGHDDHEDDGHEDDGHEDDGHEDDGHDDHEDEAGHDDRDEKMKVAAEHELAFADGDPHMWLTVANAMVYVRNIADAIVAADPANASAYREREEAYLAELQELEEEVRATISRIPEDSRVLIVYHDAFQYFAAEYGLELAAALLPGNPSQQASASAVAEIIEIVGGREVGAVYREPQFAAEAIEAIAEAAGVRVLTLYSAAFTDEVDSYIKLMRENAHALVDGLGGG